MKNKIIDINLSRSDPYECIYLDGRTAIAQIVYSDINKNLHTNLVQSGFRRSGRMVYRPQCYACEACVSVRLPVGEFRANRSQIRAFKKHQNIHAQIMPLEFNPEHYALYISYQETRHSEGRMAHDSVYDYSEFILNTPTESALVEFRLDGILKMVSLVDWLDDGLSAVYTFYDPHDRNASYGVYNVLWQIEQVRALGLSYVYLGHWIDGYVKMKYKERYRPLEKLVENQWVNF